MPSCLCLSLSLPLFLSCSLFVRQFASCLRDRRRDGETRHVCHYRNRDASAAALILLLTPHRRHEGNARFRLPPAGMQAVIAIFGIAWMGDTFLQGNMLQLTQSIEGSGEANAVAVRDSLVCHVDSAL